jgi:hypothetical protein
MTDGKPSGSSGESSMAEIRIFGKKALILYCFHALILLMLPVQCFCGDQDDLWVFSAGYAHYAGFEDVRSAYKKNAAAEGASRDVVQWTFGFLLEAHCRMTETVRIGGGVGPVMMLLRDADHIQIPTSVSLIASLLPNHTHSPFVRIGGSYHIAAGDDLRHSRPGMLAGLGMAFFARKKLHLTVEIAYDGAYVTIKRFSSRVSEKIRAGSPVFLLSAVF